MKKSFEKLQNQHPSVKTRVALSVAVALTALIALILLTTLPLRFEDTAAQGSNSNSASVVTAASNAAAPQIQNLQESWNTISGLEINQGGSADSSQTAQDQSQDYGFPADAAQVNSEVTY